MTRARRRMVGSCVRYPPPFPLLSLALLLILAQEGLAQPDDRARSPPTWRTTSDFGPRASPGASAPRTPACAWAATSTAVSGLATGWRSPTAPPRRARVASSATSPPQRAPPPPTSRRSPRTTSSAPPRASASSATRPPAPSASSARSPVLHRLPRHYHLPTCGLCSPASPSSVSARVFAAAYVSRVHGRDHYSLKVTVKAPYTISGAGIDDFTSPATLLPCLRSLSKIICAKPGDPQWVSVLPAEQY